MSITVKCPCKFHKAHEKNKSHCTQCFGTGTIRVTLPRKVATERTDGNFSVPGKYQQIPK